MIQDPDVATTTNVPAYDGIAVALFNVKKRFGSATALHEVSLMGTADIREPSAAQ